MKNTPRRLKGSGHPVSSSFDLLTIDQEILFGVSGRGCLTWSLSGADIFMKSDSEVLQVYRGIENLTHHLPAGMGLQLRIRQQSGTPEENPELMPSWGASLLNGMGDHSSQKDRLFIEERIRDASIRFLRKRDLFLSLVSYGEETKKLLAPSWHPIRQISSMLGRDLVGQYGKTASSLRKAGALVEAMLPGCGLLGRRMMGEELARYLFTLANPLYQGLLPDHLLSDSHHSTLRERISQTSFWEKEEGIVAVDPSGLRMLGKMHALRLLPFEVDRETLSPLLFDLDFPHDLVMNIWKPNHERLAKKVQSDATINRFLTYILPGRSYRIESEISSAEEFLTRSFDGPAESRVPLVMNMCIGVWSRDEAEAVSRGEMITQCFAAMNGAMAGVDPYRQWPLFLSGLPLEGDANDRWEGLLSRECSRLLPVWDGSMCDPDPWFWGKNHLSECAGLNFWRPQDPNHNGLVVGRSGGGKSFAIKMLVGQFLVHSGEHQVIVVENGGDFERHCEYFEGDYVRIDLSGQYSLNPFPIRRFIMMSMGPPREYDPDLLGFLCGVVETFLASSLEVTSLHRRILTLCLEEVYDQLPGDDVRPVLSHLVRELFRFRGRDREDEETGYRMGKILESWVGGMYGPLLNSGEGISTSGRLLAFDLSGLEHHEPLKAVVFAYIAGLSLWRLLSGSGAKRLFLVFDEAHRILAHLRGTSFLSHLYRTVRKYGGGVIAISQSPEDFLGEDLSAGILNNTSWKWIFPVSTKEEELLAFGLTPREIELLATLDSRPGDFSEVLFSRQGQSMILRLEPSLLEYWLSAKSPEEDRVVNERVLETGGLKEALKSLLEER
ncbi:MAG: VirB4 family type IV secretion system protein [Leptospirillum sp.]|jgi:hypothetical protein